MGRQVKDNGQTTGSTVITGYKVSRKLCIAMDTHWPDDWVATTSRVDLTKWPVSAYIFSCVPKEEFLCQDSSISHISFHIV